MKQFKKDHYEKVFKKEKSLMDILDELTIHCKNVTGKDEEISIVLPKSVIDRFSIVLEPKEKIFDNLAIKTTTIKTVSKIHGNGGTVKLYNSKDNEVTLKNT